MRWTDRVTFLVVRPGSDKPRRYSVPQPVIYGVLASVVLLLATTTFLTLWSRGLMLEANQSRALRLEVLRLGQENMKIQVLEDELDRITQSQDRVLQWAGLPPLEDRLMAARADDSEEESANVLQLLSISADSSGERLIPHESREGWRWPLQGWISRGFGHGDTSPLHFGVDIVAARGTPVVAASKGTVTYAGWDEELGNMVILQHAGGYTTTYGHNDVLLVSSGDEVNEGDVIAKVGSTGHSSAPHLHFEIRFAESPLDPKEFLDGRGEGS
jgi:murein DD-endopeptidase MepM/ murein hydrolase activator NlpD